MIFNYTIILTLHNWMLCLAATPFNFNFLFNFHKNDEWSFPVTNGIDELTNHKDYIMKNISKLKLLAMEAPHFTKRIYSEKLNVNSYAFVECYLMFISEETHWISSSQKVFNGKCTNLNEIKKNYTMNWNQKEVKNYSHTKPKAMIRLNDYHLYWWWFSCVLFCRLNIFVSHSNEKLCA